MKRLWLMVTVCLILAGPSQAQQRDYSAVVIKPTHISGPVHMLEGMGGNIGVSAGEDGVLIIDDQFAPLADKIKAALSGINPGALKFVLNTHFHGDHTGGNPIFGKEATIVAHTNVRKRLIEGNTDKAGWPVVTYDEEISIHFNGERIWLMHLPNGHTDTDAVIYFTNSNVLHMGDHFFNGRFPYVDLGSGGTVQGLIQNVGAVLSRVPPDIRIIPGHGALAAKSDLNMYYGMLLATTDIVRKHMADGKTLDQIKAAGFPAQWSAWGEGFVSGERWIETIYNSYSE